MSENIIHNLEKTKEIIRCSFSDVLGLTIDWAIFQLYKGRGSHRLYSAEMQIIPAQWKND